MAPTKAALEQYIRQSAAARGIDPNIAVRVARSEGLGANPNEAWQSYAKNKRGLREPSYTPFQLLVGGPGTGFPKGMGNDFINQTGLDPRDPKNVFQAIDYALDRASTGGWSPWYGAAKVGVSKWDGLKGSSAKGVSKSQNPQNINYPAGIGANMYGPPSTAQAGDEPAERSALARALLGKQPTPGNVNLQPMPEIASSRYGGAGALSDPQITAQQAGMFTTLPMGSDVPTPTPRPMQDPFSHGANLRTPGSPVPSNPAQRARDALGQSGYQGNVDFHGRSMRGSLTRSPEARPSIRPKRPAPQGMLSAIFRGM